ncbi:amidase domain-containing protein [Ruminococcus sp.]|uniref:amidase domain-containing protein n=1 Tax=Ruminococcus sp. TaxID=41978 RepID=UPI002E75CEA2|nr:amidase domain-containing protein [Ruminococcus sp.]MEE1261865.1 amidase domain-containing protein [Ruminococcus sp.]
MTFDYVNDQVTKVTEYGSDDTEGNYIEMEYGSDNTTVFTDKQERTSTYTFDNYGNKVSVLNANGYLENNGGSGFSALSGADSFTKNYITQSTVQNTSYFTKVDGDRAGVTSSGGTFNVDGDEHFLGSTSVKICNPESNNNAAFFTGAFHQFNDTSFNGEDVTFSAYVKVEDVAQINTYTGGPVGATLKIKCFDANNNPLSDNNSIGYTGTKDWQRLSISTTIPENTHHFRIYCNLRYASGTAWFDCLQLEEGNAVNDFNALQNADFSNNDAWFTDENNAISAQNGAVTLNGVAGSYNDAVEETTEAQETTVEATEPATTVVEVMEPAEFGNITATDASYGNVTMNERGQVIRRVRKTYLIDSGTEAPDTTEATEATETIEQTEATETTEETEETSGGGNEEDTDSLGNKYIYQNVNVNRKGICFNIVGEAQAKSVPLSNETRTFGIALNIYYENDNTPETHYQEFNSNTDKKQTVSLSVCPNDDSKVIDHVAFAFVYGYNKNSMTAYDAMLNIASTAASDESGTSSGEGEPSSSNGGENEPDDFIDYEVVSETLDTSQEYMRSTTTYTSDGNYTASQTDEAGHTVYYTYDVDGNVTESIDGNGYDTQYEYDAAGNVTKLKSGTSQNLYSYNGAGTISAIQHNGFQYDFNYDVFGKLISTKIGNTALSSNTYSASGLLTRTTYANGDYIDYSYDDYDRVVQMEDENDVFARFVYNKKGLVTKYIDDLSGITTYYYYDFSGSKTGEYRQTEGGDLSYYLSYDSNGNTVEKTAVDNEVRTITKGNDSDGNAFVSNDGVTVTSKKDDFGRLSNVTTTRENSNVDLKLEYTYLDGTNSNSTTNLVDTLTQKLGTTTIGLYSYDYDENNNITYIYENGSSESSVEYEYDHLNQLTREIDYINRTYTNYHYDGSGNISSVDQYGFYGRTGQPTNFLGEATYSYDGTWKDKLTSYNGTTITYDALGNPLNYRNGMSFTWVRGRLLDTVAINNTTIQMCYDSNGLRTQKGNVQYFYDSNNNLIALTNSGATLFFYYDESGMPNSFSDGTNMYYYVKNLQGDIVKIVNETGSVIVNYAYNVWGKLLSVTNGSGAAITDTTHIAYLNPLRYRGYVYDDETGLYYLQSRYYDPTTCRFINADNIDYLANDEKIFNTNLFTYCNNNFRESDYNGKYSSYFSSKTYNRSNAINYAAHNFRRTTGSKMFRYLGNDRDCANFVSQCLYAGGIRMSNGWHYFLRPFGKDTYTYSWTVADNQYRYFKLWGFTKYVITITKKIYNDKKNLKRLISNYRIKSGDLLYMDFNADNRMDHATMLTGHSDCKELYYTAHSNACYAKRVSLAFADHPKMIIKIILLV